MMIKFPQIEPKEMGSNLAADPLGRDRMKLDDMIPPLVNEELTEGVPECECGE